MSSGERVIRTASELVGLYRAGERDFRSMDTWALVFDLRGACLEDADFSRAWICADFRGANLRRARFVDGNVKTSDFGGADLTGADFSGCAIDCATFKGAVLNGVKFLGATFMGHAMTADELPPDCR